MLDLAWRIELKMNGFIAMKLRRTLLSIVMGATLIAPSLEAAELLTYELDRALLASMLTLF